MDLKKVEWLTDTGVAAYLKEKRDIDISPATIAQWRHRRQGPVYHRVNGAVRYATVDVDRWLAAGRVEPSSGPVPIAASGAASGGGLTGAVHP